MIWGNTEVHKSARRARRTAAAFATLVCALLALAALPALASAAIFEVNSPNDGAKTAVGAICEATFPTECTLRAAIEAANEDSSPDEITFSSVIFNGVAGTDELEPATALPTITEPASIVGRALASGAYLKPSVGVKAPVGAAALTVGSDGVAVEHVAHGGGQTGIEVLGGSTGFLAVGDWLGLRLDAGARAIGGAGIHLGPGADGATIGAGESELANRNVFGNSKVGVLVEGASETKILGNYVGVDPEGKGPATLGAGVRIVDAEGAPAVKAQENEVGGVLTTAAAATAECDGACNVIATEGGPGVDLGGEETEAVDPASGPTRIRGNYLGLAADGIAPVGEAGAGVYAGPTQPGCGAGPADVTVGGAVPTETNFVDGGTTGVFAEGAENLRVLGNSIGLAADGSAGEPPIAAGIEVCAEGVVEPAQISNNDMVVGTNAIGIESAYGKAQITGNAILGGQIGLFIDGESEGHGDLISGNTVTDPVERGIYILNQSNVLTGNTITNAGNFGIELEGEADHNRIGGDAPGEENSIEGSGEGAISISGEESTRNEVAANNGVANAGAFIQLAGTVGETPNGGIKPPTFATALQSSATGTAQPNATVRIFRKASPEAGELAALLAVVKADALGNWSATYATVPVGTLVAATQTSSAGTPEGATSEVGAPTAASADPPKPPEPEKGGGSGGGPSNPAPNPVPIVAPAPQAPTVKITAGPKKSSKATTAKFRFKADPAAGAKFECKLGGAKWAKCSSPKTYKKLKPGRHAFRVRAVVSGLTGAAKTFKFTVTA